MARMVGGRSHFHFVALAALAAAAVVARVAPAYAMEAAEEAAVDGDVELPQIIAPMVVGGDLRGYAYFTISLVPASRDKILLIREKVPFIQDSFLRELNRGSIMMAADPASVDTEAVKSRLMARVAQVLPSATVADLHILQVVLAPFRPQS